MVTTCSPKKLKKREGIEKGDKTTGEKVLATWHDWVTEGHGAARNEKEKKKGEQGGLVLIPGGRDLRVSKRGGLIRVYGKRAGRG